MIAAATGPMQGGCAFVPSPAHSVYATSDSALDDVATGILAPHQPLWQVSPAAVPQACQRRRGFRCRSSVVEHSLGKGEVDSSILSGSTSRNIEKSEIFSDFRRERRTIEKSKIVQNDPATPALSDTLVAHWNTFRSATARRPGSARPLRSGVLSAAMLIS